MRPTIPAVVPPLPHDNPFKRRYAPTASFQWLAAGWRDLLTKPAPSLIYGFVYVTDRGNAAIVELRPGATAAIPLPFTDLNDPQGVAVDPAGDVYVVDRDNGQVVKLAAD